MTRSLMIGFILISILSLLACGVSNNSTLSLDRTSSSNSSNQVIDPNAPTDQIAVSVERINGDINTVSTGQITIVSLNENFEEVGDSSIPFFKVIEAHTISDSKDKSAGPRYIIQFDNVYEEQVNHVLKVIFNRNEVLYAPLHKLQSNIESVNVNARTHYVLKKLFDTITTEDQLNDLRICSDSTLECPTQAKAKSALLEGISNAAQRYDIDVTATLTADEIKNFSLTVDEVMTLLDQRIDFKSHVETAVKEITRTTSPIAKGTRRNVSIGLGTDSGTDESGAIFSRLTIPIEYNSLLLAFSLSDIKPGDQLNEVRIGVSTSKIVEPSDSNELPVYPTFNQSITLLDLRRDNLSSDIPFARTTLSINNSDSFKLNRNEPINSLTSSLNDSLLTTQSFLMNEREVDQVIPSGTNSSGTNSSSKIGWQLEPFFSKLYQVNDFEPDSSFDSNVSEVLDFGSTPTWLVAANYAQGANYQLITANESDVRGGKLEDIDLFSWEIHSRQTDDTFSISDITGKKYGVISYSLKMNDENTVMALFAETLHWDVLPGGNISVTQPSSLSNHYRTYTLTRQENNAVSGVDIPANAFITSHHIFAFESKVATQTAPAGVNTNLGLIKLDGGSTAPQGHSTQNGKHLAFVFDTTDVTVSEDRGKGMIIATEMFATSPIFSGETYQLQGNSFGMNASQNSLQNVNGSTLVMTNRATNDPAVVDCHADLTLKRITVIHSVGTNSNTLSAPSESSDATTSSTGCILKGSEIKLTFNNVSSQPLTLKGFMTQHGDGTTPSAPTNLMNLLWIQGDNLGFVFANKEQNLSPTFATQ